MNIGIIASQYKVGVIVPGDTTAPIITLTGGNITIDEGIPYSEPGFEAVDDVDGNITANVIVNYDGLDINDPVEGEYTITYNVSDAAGNPAVQKSRIVTVEAVVVDNEAPSAPTNVQVINITYDEARVTWGASSDNVAIRGYVVMRLIGGVYLNQSTESLDLFYEFPEDSIGPGAGQTPSSYTIKIRAYDTSNNFTDSTPVTFETWSLPGSGNSAQSNLTYTSMDISWDAFEAGTFAISGYDVYLEGIKQNVSLITSPREWSFTDLTPGTTYGYNIVAVDANGRYREPQNPIEFTTTGALSPATIDTTPFTATSQFSGVTKNMMVRYPEGYDQNTNHNALLVLHGKDEFSTNIAGLLLNSFPHEVDINNQVILDELDRLKIVLVAIQQPSKTSWSGAASGDSWSEPYINDAITYIKTLKVDPNKISINGLSMGGGGAIRFAYENPSLIYKCLAFCPSSSTSYASVFAEQVPLWAFHGENDNLTGFGNGATGNLIDAIQDYIIANPETGIYPPKYTRPAGGGHSSAWIKPSQEIGFAVGELAADFYGNGVDPAGLANGVGILEWCFS